MFGPSTRAAIRTTLVSSVAGLCLAPLAGLGLALPELEPRDWRTLIGPVASQTMGRTGLQILCVAAIALLVGWPLGTTGGLDRFRGERLCHVPILWPLFLPPFFVALGWSSLRSHTPYRAHGLFDGRWGSYLCLALMAVPLVTIGAHMAARAISRDQADALRLAGGASRLWRGGLRLTLAPALLAALAGALLTAGDPGVGQIMGHHGLATDILIAMAARQNMALACAKVLGFVLVLLPVMLLLVGVFMRHLGAAAAGRERHCAPSGLGGRWRALHMGLLLIYVVFLLLPMSAGLLYPAWTQAGHEGVTYALRALGETWRNTLWYSGVAGAVAAGAALLGVLAAGDRHRRPFFLFALALTAIPGPFYALGIVTAASHAPAAFDPLTRGGWTAAIGSGIRFVPLAILLTTAAWDRLPRSQREAARVHGVGPATVFVRIALPWLWPTTATCWVAVALLAMADISSLLLLQPVGESTYVSRVFGVMDNASQGLVASMALVQVAVALMAAAALALADPSRWLQGSKDHD